MTPMPEEQPDPELQQIGEEVEGLMDDIEYDTCQYHLLDQIENFLDQFQLSSEDIIQDHIFADEPKYFSLKKETLLPDIKQFLYTFCTTGSFYHHGDSDLDFTPI